MRNEAQRAIAVHKIAIVAPHLQHVQTGLKSMQSQVAQQCKAVHGQSFTPYNLGHVNYSILKGLFT